MTMVKIRTIAIPRDSQQATIDLSFDVTSRSVSACVYTQFCVKLVDNLLCILMSDEIYLQFLL